MPAFTPSLEGLLLLYARRFPIRRGKLRIVDALWKRAVGAGGDHKIARLKHGGLRMPCDVSELLQRQFYFFGTYFAAETSLTCWEREARTAKVILDVGANAGIFSLAATVVAPAAEIHAFEPTPEIAAKLRQTIALNGLQSLHVHELAVWSDDGRAALQRYRGDRGTNDGMNFVTSRTDAADVELVDTIRLDTFCRNRGIDQIDLLKLDIQGNEPRALQGARELLRAGRVRTIFAELNWGARDSACPARQSIQLLEHLGYSFSQPMPRLQWRGAGPWMHELDDIVARRMPTGESLAAY